MNILKKSVSMKRYVDLTDFPSHSNTLLPDITLGKALVYALLASSQQTGRRSATLPYDVVKILNSFHPSAHDIDDLVLNNKTVYQ